MFSKLAMAGGTGTSSRQLLNKLRISMFSKLAMAGGTSVILLWLRVSLVTFFIAHNLDISGSRARIALSEKSSSAFGTFAASSSVFLMIFEVILFVNFDICCSQICRKVGADLVRFLCADVVMGCPHLGGAIPGVLLLL